MKNVFKLVAVPRHRSDGTWNFGSCRDFGLSTEERFACDTKNSLRVSCSRHRHSLVYAEGHTTVSPTGKILCFLSQKRAEICAARFYDARPEIVAYEVWRVSVGTFRHVRGCEHGVFAKAVTLIKKCATIMNCGLREECMPILFRVGVKEPFDWNRMGSWLSQERYRTHNRT